jgi:hypothetical protein
VPLEVERRRGAAHSGGGPNRRACTALVVIALLTTGAATQAQTPAAADAPRAQPTPVTRPPYFTREQVAAAVEKLKTDPNLGTEKKARRLVQNSRPESNVPSESPGWLRWITAAFAWLADAARALLWVAGILLVGILALYIKRFVESRGERSVPLRFSMPTHVRDLDIRPESLPDDIGSAAGELWARGEHRAALALLYRGLLSRLAHVHGVPIRDSSTEGDCLKLAEEHLPAARSAYVGRLIRVWQRAVYGNTDPTNEEFQLLSSGFSAAVDEPTPAATGTVERAA